MRQAVSRIQIWIRAPIPGNSFLKCIVFVAASHQTGLEARSKARRPIKVGTKERGRSGTSETRTLQVCAAHRPTKCNVALMRQAVSRIQIWIRAPIPGNSFLKCIVFVAASHQTGLEARSKARRPIKVGTKERGRSGTSETRTLLVCAAHRPTKCNVALMRQAVSRIQIWIRAPMPGNSFLKCIVFVAASHQTGLEARSKARRPIKVGTKERGRSGTSETRTLLVCAAHRPTKCNVALMRQAVSRIQIWIRAPIPGNSFLKCISVMPNKN